MHTTGNNNSNNNNVQKEKDWYNTNGRAEETDRVFVKQDKLQQHGHYRHRCLCLTYDT